MKFQIIKKTEFSFEKDGAQVKGQSIVVAHKARAIQVSTLNFDKDELSVEGNELVVKCEVELIPSTFTGSDGQARKGIKMVPKMDLAISAL